MTIEKELNDIERDSKEIPFAYRETVQKLCNFIRHQQEVIEKMRESLELFEELALIDHPDVNQFTNQIQDGLEALALKTREGLDLDE